MILLTALLGCGPQAEVCAEAEDVLSNTEWRTGPEDAPEDLRFARGLSCPSELTDLENHGSLYSESEGAPVSFAYLVEAEPDEAGPGWMTMSWSEDPEAFEYTVFEVERGEDRTCLRLGEAPGASPEQRPTAVGSTCWLPLGQWGG